jgi:hypothetical protein
MTSSSQQLFVVGSPRSGTTLLRNLLHGHPEIALTAYESHFVPAALQRHGLAPDFSRPEAVESFLRRFKRGLLYQKGLERGTFRPTDSELRTAIARDSWAEILRALFDLYCEKEMARASFWGDKTPTYVDHIDLIDAALPDARFAHIIRDPRDQALSERAIWGKSLRRSGESWRRRVTRARASAVAADGRYFELTYEAMVANPEAELRRLCSWLELDFDRAMLDSASGSDELGQMVGARAVSTAAVGGRRGSLSAREEMTISALIGEIGRSLSYDLPVAAPRRLSSLGLFLLGLHDRLRFTAYFVKQKGISGGVRFTVGSFLDSRD